MRLERLGVSNSRYDDLNPFTKIDSLIPSEERIILDELSELRTPGLKMAVPYLSNVRILRWYCFYAAEYGGCHGCVDLRMFQATFRSGYWG